MEEVAWSVNSVADLRSSGLNISELDHAESKDLGFKVSCGTRIRTTFLLICIGTSSWQTVQYESYTIRRCIALFLFLIFYKC